MVDAGVQIPLDALDKNVLLGEQPASKPGTVGSNPTVLAHVLVGQPGVAATLSRWRSWVQIPSGTLSSRGRPVRRPSDTRVEVGSTPTGWTDQSRGAAECSPPRHGGGRWFESSRDYCSELRSPNSSIPRPTLPGFSISEFWLLSSDFLTFAEWTGVWFPARSHKPSDAGSNPASATRRQRSALSSVQSGPES